MTELEEFQLDLYHAKLQYMSEGSALRAGLWDQETQRNIDALSYACFPGTEIEAHIIAAKNHFGNKIALADIIEIAKESCKNQTDKSNKFSFTNFFFNRLTIFIERRK